MAAAGAEVQLENAEPHVPQIPSYTLKEFLGQGGFAQVWAATRNGDDVAIKVAKSRVDDQRRRLRDEAAALQGVGYRVAPTFIELGTAEDGRAFLAMERLAGVSLAAMLSTGYSEWRSWQDVAVGLAEAISVIHEAGWIHRDLKPENIFVWNSSIRILDFGIATRTSAAKTVSIAGSAEYMAPEAIRGDAITPAVDIYGFGVILFELLTGRPPFVGDSAEVEGGHLTRRAPSVDRFAATSVALNRLVLECLAKKPSDRPNARSLCSQLRAAFDESSALLPKRAETTSSLLQSRNETAVLVALENGHWGSSLDELLVAARASIATQDGRRVLCVLHNDSEVSPVVRGLEFAIAAAPALQCHATVHLAEVEVRHGRRRKRIRGDAVEHPKRWLASISDGVPERVLITAPAAEALGDRVVAIDDSASAASYWKPRSAGDASDVELIGNDDVIADARCFLTETRGPLLLTLLAEPGHGRSRILREIARLETIRRVWWLTPNDVSRLGNTLGGELRAWATEAPSFLLVDDLHERGDAVLEAVEFATLNGDGVELAVFCAATKRLFARRPAWGSRAETARTLRIDALGDDDAIELAAAFLRPADYLPKALLLELARFSGNSPAILRDVIECLKRDGQLQDRGITSSQTVSSSVLDSLRSSPAQDWLVRKKLSSLPAEFAAFARIAAVFGEHVQVDAFAAVLEASTRAGEASSPIDSAVGFEGLSSVGLVEVGDEPGWWRFSRRGLREALASSVALTDQQSIHSHAVEFWKRTPPIDERSLTALAASAHGAGELGLATHTRLLLGRMAETSHRFVLAERLFSSILETDHPVDDAIRNECYIGRGRARYRMHRTDDAVRDFDAANGYSSNDAERLEAELEAAVALDWADRFPEAEARANRAEAIFADMPVASRDRFRAQHEVTLGRVAWRRGELATSIERFESGCALARELHDDRSLVAGLLLLGPAQVFAGDLKTAEKTFAEVIAHCETTNDPFHLATAFSNRSFLWSATQNIDALIADLDRAISLARQVGQPMLERAASHNLAEFLHWSGSLDRALELAKRAAALAQRFVPVPQVADTLLLARVHAARNDRAQTAAMLKACADAVADDEPPLHLLMLRALHAWLGGPEMAGEWTEMSPAIGELPPEEQVELWDRVRHWAARAKDSKMLRDAETRGTQAIVLSGFSQDWWQRNRPAPINT